MPELVARGQQLLAQAAVGAGDDVDGEVGGGAVELPDRGVARAQAARAAHDENAPAVFARDAPAARRQHVGLDRNAEEVDAFGRGAEDHQPVHGGFGGHDVADALVGRHVPEAVGQEIGDDAPQRDGLALPPGIGGEDGKRMGLGADDGVGLEGVHQDAQLEAVAALDEGADPLGEPVEPEIVVERLPQFRRAADRGHVGVLDEGAPGGMRRLEQVEAARFRHRVQLLDLGLDGAGRGVVAAVADEVADQDARGRAGHGALPAAASSSAW